MTWQLGLEWLTLFLFLGFGVYTMWVIKNEKRTYIETAREVHFQCFKFFIPSWWGEVAKTPEQISFKRLDTRYEWEAHFTWHPNSSGIHDIIDLFKKQIEERKILFDEDTSIIYNPGDFKVGPVIQSGRFEMVRLEGTATADRVDRLYYDAFLVREKATGAFMYAESRSSVLNGLVEGPYFEEVMNRLELL